MFNVVKIVDKKKSEELTEILWIGPSEIALLTFHNEKYYAAFKMCGEQRHATLWKNVPIL